MHSIHQMISVWRYQVRSAKSYLCYTLGQKNLPLEPGEPFPPPF